MPQRADQGWGMKTSSVKFRFLEHTADMGMEVVGETLEELSSMPPKGCGR